MNVPFIMKRKLKIIDPLNLTFSLLLTIIKAKGNVKTVSQLIYIWTLVSGQPIQANGNPYRAQAQFRLSGVNQTTSADFYNVTATTISGLSGTFFGYFSGERNFFIK
jgi:hypothetical protein